MRKKKVCKCIVWSVISLVFAVLIYYSAEVVICRSKTPAIVDSYYQSGEIMITLDDLTQEQIDIFLTVEDPGFYTHHGVDFTTPGAGWTTITQGLAKKFYFKEFQQGLMKIKQTLCAWLALDPLVDKDTQLTVYINIMYYGNGIYGLHDASNFYFKKMVSALSTDEYIALIASLMSPEELNVKDKPQENAQRVERIIKVLSGEYEPEGLFDIEYLNADK